MISNETKQTVSTSEGVRIVGNFRITDATQARIMISLADKIYTRKELAIVREYSNNMADAQREAGKSIADCIVTFPTMDESVIKFRDFGLGLTETEIANIYCVFGESTKRNSNEYNGVLGYGAKSAFGLSDSFTVTSWVNGEKSIYQCIKGDTTRLHEAMLLSRCPSDEPTGIEVCVPIKNSLLWTIHSEAASFFKLWPIIPQFVNFNESDLETLNKFRNTAPTLQGEGWSIRPKSESTAIGVAYMGGVGYPIQWNTLYNHMALDSKTRVLFELLQSNDLVMTFAMGEIQFVDSREGLEYTEFTLKALTDRIISIFNKIKDSIQVKFNDASTIWEAKKIYNAIFGTDLGLYASTDDDDDDDDVDTIGWHSYS